MTVHVIDATGKPLFIGRPADDSEYVQITRVAGKPTLLEVRCSDLSASIDRILGRDDDG